MLSCNSSNCENINLNKVHSYTDLVKIIGKCNNETIVKVYDGVRLYEYQNNLYKFIKDSDTLFIKESVWDCGKKKLIIWHLKNKIIDTLKMDSNIEY